jgi:hypothetical protein
VSETAYTRCHPMRCLIAAIVVAAAPLALTACGSPEPPKQQAFAPGVEGRGADEVCNSTSKECQEWTALAQQCQENMRRRDEGYMGRLEPYCDQMETYRERVTGIALSSDPGAYNF